MSSTSPTRAASFAPTGGAAQPTLIARAAPSRGNRPTSAPRPYNGKLAGHDIQATPLRQENGTTVWQVTVSGPDGTLGRFITRLKGQFGDEQLANGASSKRQVLQMVAAQNKAPDTLRVDIEAAARRQRSANGRGQLGVLGSGLHIPYVNPDFASGPAQTIARNSGLRVQTQRRDGPPLAVPQASAWVNIPNTEQGGRIYARMGHQEVGYSGSQGGLPLPERVSPAFLFGYHRERERLNMEQAVQVASTVVYAGAGAAAQRIAAAGARPSGRPGALAPRGRTVPATAVEAPKTPVQAQLARNPAKALERLCQLHQQGTPVTPADANYALRINRKAFEVANNGAPLTKQQRQYLAKHGSLADRLAASPTPQRQTPAPAAPTKVAKPPPRAQTTPRSSSAENPSASNTPPRQPPAARPQAAAARQSPAAAPPHQQTSHTSQPVTPSGIPAANVVHPQPQQQQQGGMHAGAGAVAVLGRPPSFPPFSAWQSPQQLTQQPFPERPTGRRPATPPATHEGDPARFKALAADPAAAQNAGSLQRIRTASPKEINQWMESLSAQQRLALPPAVQDAILENLRRRIAPGSARINPMAPAGALVSDPVFQRHGRELLKDMRLQMEAGQVSTRVSQHGPFTAVLFDSGNGGLAAAGVASNLLNQYTGGRVQIVTMGDHQNQPYGTKDEQQITGLVFNGIRTGASFDPDVIAMACNTACIALFRANETKTPVPSNGVPVLNLIENTARVVADPANRTAFGSRPLILSTQATVNSNLYPTLISQYSNGEVKPYNVGGSDAPVTSSDGRTEIRDLATLVNQLAHRNHARKEEVMNAARHYVAKMPEHMTSMVMCCTHYPESIPFFRRALDERGMHHVPIFDPMPDQILSIVRTLDRSVAGVEPPPLQRPAGPNVVLTSATGTDNPDAPPGSGLQTFEDLFPSVPALSGENAAVFSGKSFGADYDPRLVRSFIEHELSAVDAATAGFHGRNLHTFFNPGGARNAASELNEAQNVMLLTGFNVPPDLRDPNSVPRPETDGPPGTAALANGLLNMGKKVTIVTDSANRPVVEAAMLALGADLSNPNLALVEFNAKGPEAEDLGQELLARIKPDVVGAIELPGRNAAGKRTNMGGIVIDGYNPDLDAIMLQASSQGTRTFGVGDGGNEAGMGHLDLSRVALPTPTVVGADIAVTAENSNLGAYAILAELAGLNGQFDMLLTPEQLRSSVAASVEAGAVDGVSRESQATVDGFSLDYHGRTIERLNGAVQGTWPAPR